MMSEVVSGGDLQRPRSAVGESREGGQQSGRTALGCLSEKTLRVSQNQGYHFVGPNNQDRSILGLYWGPLFQGNYHMMQSAAAKDHPAH